MRGFRKSSRREDRKEEGRVGGWVVVTCVKQFIMESMGPVRLKKKFIIQSTERVTTWSVSFSPRLVVVDC